MVNIKLSKLLSFVLRHGASELGIEMGQDGFVKLSELLCHSRFRHFNESQVLNVVRECPKQRFYIEIRNNEVFIRANQGHSMNLEIDMVRVLDADSIPIIVHGTSKSAWSIIQTCGLSKMKRQHIHFATGLFADPQVKSGIRRNCEILIYINAAKAMEDGIVFVKSHNGVILTEGIDGILATKYFERVTDANDNIILF